MSFLWSRTRATNLSSSVSKFMVGESEKIIDEILVQVVRVSNQLSHYDSPKKQKNHTLKRGNIFIGKCKCTERDSTWCRRLSNLKSSKYFFFDEKTCPVLKMLFVIDMKQPITIAGKQFIITHFLFAIPISKPLYLGEPL